MYRDKLDASSSAALVQHVNDRLIQVYMLSPFSAFAATHISPSWTAMVAGIRDHFPARVAGKVLGG
jgi:predicted secreted Zn-dependent protease